MSRRFAAKQPAKSFATRRCDEGTVSLLRDVLRARESALAARGAPLATGGYADIRRRAGAHREQDDVAPFTQEDGAAARPQSHIPRARRPSSSRRGSDGAMRGPLRDLRHDSIAGGPMTLATGWPHEGGENPRGWPHEGGDWQRGHGRLHVHSSPHRVGIRKDERFLCSGGERARRGRPGTQRRAERFAAAWDRMRPGRNAATTEWRGGRCHSPDEAQAA